MRELEESMVNLMGIVGMWNLYINNIYNNNVWRYSWKKVNLKGYAIKLLKY